MLTSTGPLRKPFSRIADGRGKSLDASSWSSAKLQRRRSSRTRSSSGRRQFFVQACDSRHGWSGTILDDPSRPDRGSVQCVPRT